ncbi:MAG: MFS transporter [Gammaproteobacteria bacterium]
MKYFSSLLSSSLGNVLEWYDFGLFAIFSTLFGKLFFPSDDPQTSIIATVSIFAIGFLCRPIGALIFGYLGDKTGRAKTLRLSILMITLPTLFIGLLPTYQQIGIWAPILLMLTRIWQGISIGGEYSGNIIYLAENAPVKYRATFTALASSGANLGILLAALVGAFVSYYFTNEMLADWGWRLPYLISGLFSLFIYKIRLHMQESRVFVILKRQHKIVSNPISFVFQHNIPQIMRTLGLVCMGSTFYYFCFIYLPVFFNANHYLSIHQTTVSISILIAVMMVIAPLAGFISDHIGRKRMLVFNALLITLGIIPGLYLAITYHHLLLPMLSLFAIASALEQGVTSAAVVENFPTPARYTGVSLGYNLGNGILGGTVPLVCEWIAFKTQLGLAPAVYIATCALITLLTVIFYIHGKKEPSNDLNQIDKGIRH